ncbi:MAG: DJ-1/PfpI family protein [Bacteroidales bacterium]|nr:DJ-1/PfpI family protein [Bacteroidales bacterium]
MSCLNYFFSQKFHAIFGENSMMMIRFIKALQITLVLLLTANPNGKTQTINPETMQDLSSQNAVREFSGTPRVLCLLSNKFGANTHFNIDNMRTFGWEPTIAGLTDTVQPCPWSDDFGNLPFAVDTIFTEISNISNWDVLAIMPANWWTSGGAYVDLLNSPESLALIADAVSNGLIVWATCAGVRVLAAADVINGVSVTGKGNFQNEYLAAGANYLGENILPVIDGNIVTSTKGMYFNTEIIEAIETAIENQADKRGSIEDHNPETILETTTVDLKNDIVLWSKTFGTDKSEGAKCILGLGNDKYYVSGFMHTEAYMADALSIWIDAAGTSGLFCMGGGINNEFVDAACAGDESSVLTAGYTASFGAGQKDMEITKLDENGSMNWFSTFGGQGIDVAKSIVKLSDGNHLACGYTESFGAGENDIYLVKLFPNGQMIWERTYGGAKAERGLKALEMNDGSYLVVGETGSVGAGKKDVYLLKIDTQGEVVWQRTFGDEDYQSGRDVIETSEGNILIVGSSDIHGDDFLNIYLIKTDLDGNLIWEKQYACPLDFYEYGISVIETLEGSYLISSTVNDAQTRENDAYLLMLDQDGTELWSDTFGGSRSDRLLSLTQTNDQCFILAGQTNSWGAGEYDMWIVKISNPLTSRAEMNTSGNIFNLLVNPKMFNQSVDIGFSTDKILSLTILDAVGRTVFNFGSFKAGYHNVCWDGRTQNGGSLPSGMYFLNLTDESGFTKISKLIFAK